ncbi:unnamed protein product [Sphenostylis stenocarpa]|uniref:Uncharacterized protein n=1 Tax=Sphenostylis stenocarpa TaxID=92480 RepID=A0AA86SU10_9FABA|nr:unnamed protein product [Sphenostylis stenocarpa]
MIHSGRHGASRGQGSAVVRYFVEGDWVKGGDRESGVCNGEEGRVEKEEVAKPQQLKALAMSRSVRWCRVSGDEGSGTVARWWCDHSGPEQRFTVTTGEA